MIRTKIALALAALLVTTAAHADAQGQGQGGGDGQGRGQNKEARDKVKEERKELREERKDLQDARKTGDAGAIKAALDDVKAGKKELTAEQKERRKAHVADVRAKWGSILKVDGVKEEMRVHASRMAKLRRIEKLAKDKSKDAVAKRAATAMEKEKARHEKKLGELKAKGGAADGGAK